MLKVFSDKENRRVEFLDQRFYIDNDGNYYPSVTTILEAYPKGARFEQWLKDMGNEADQVVERAAIQGTNVHAAVEILLKGGTVEWLQYTLDEWKMILRFREFFSQVSPVLVAIEYNLISGTIGTGGTIDMVCTIGGERWLIDTKTSGDIYDNHYIQLAVYAAMWNEIHPEIPIQRIGCLHLRSRTKGASRDGKVIHGAGWKLDEPAESPAELFEIFRHVQVLWHRLNPNARPMNQVLPSHIDLGDIVIIKDDIPKVREKIALPFE